MINSYNVYNVQTWKTWPYAIENLAKCTCKLGNLAMWT